MLFILALKVWQAVVLTKKDLLLNGWHLVVLSKNPSNFLVLKDSTYFFSWH